MTSELLSELHEAVGYLWLNRPDVHNAISRSMWEAIPSELESLKKRGAKVIVITGKGSSFASGADFRELVEIKNYEQAKDNWQSIANCLNIIAAFPLPTLAMIRGNCMGGGLLLAIACDLRYASHDASFALPVAKLGIVLDDNNIGRLVSLVGVACAKEFIFQARTISAHKAMQIKLVNDCVSENQLAEAVKLIAQDMVKNAHDSLAEAKLSCVRILEGKKTQDQAVVINSYLSDEFRHRAKALLND